MESCETELQFKVQLLRRTQLFCLLMACEHQGWVRGVRVSQRAVAVLWLVQASPAQVSDAPPPLVMPSKWPWGRVWPSSRIITQVFAWSTWSGLISPNIAHCWLGWPALGSLACEGGMCCWILPLVTSDGLCYDMQVSLLLTMTWPILSGDL